MWSIRKKSSNKAEKYLSQSTFDRVGQKRWKILTVATLRKKQGPARLDEITNKGIDKVGGTPPLGTDTSSNCEHTTWKLYIYPARLTTSQYVIPPEPSSTQPRGPKSHSAHVNNLTNREPPWWSAGDILLGNVLENPMFSNTIGFAGGPIFHADIDTGGAGR